MCAVPYRKIVASRKTRLARSRSPIKYGGKPLGAWLSLNPLCETSPGQSDSQSVGVQDTSDCSGIVEDVCHVNERQVHGVSCPNIVQSEQASICSHSANVGFPDIPYNHYMSALNQCLMK